MLNVGESSSCLYLNFAGDCIARKDAAAFATAGLDPPTLAGKRLRVRGWLAWRNGPMIEATHPDPDRAFACGWRRSERQAPATAKGYRALTAAMP
ncbi:MAG TPA: hypothetical protein VKD02_05955 [Methyloceanibacter sp.]|nr:hypothetical protein [Methyloceanibacter sp.]